MREPPDYKERKKKKKKKREKGKLGRGTAARANSPARTLRTTKPTGSVRIGSGVVVESTLLVASCESPLAPNATTPLASTKRRFELGDVVFNELIQTCFDFQLGDDATDLVLIFNSATVTHLRIIHFVEV